MLPPEIEPRETIFQSAGQRAQEELSALTQDQIYSLISISDKHPWIPPDQQLILAKTNATDRALELVSEMHLRRAMDAESEASYASYLEQYPDRAPAKTRWQEYKEATDRDPGFGLDDYVAGLKLMGGTIADFTMASGRDPFSGKKMESGGWWEPTKEGLRNVGIDDVTQWGTAILQWLPEVAQNIFATDREVRERRNADDVPDDEDEYWLGGPTTLQVMVEQFSAGNEQPGFFPTNETMSILGQYTRNYRGVIEGTNTARSIGRIAANTYFDPNTLPYNMMSGTIDAAVLLAADPTNYLGNFAKSGAVGLVKGADEVAVLTAAKLAAGEDVVGLTSRVLYGAEAVNTVPLQTVQEVAKISDSIKAQAEVSQMLAEVWTPERFTQFVKTHPRMQDLVSRLVDLKSPLQVLEDGLRGLPVPNETLIALAKADTPEKVEAILSTLWTIDKFAFPRDMRQVARGVVRSKIGDVLTEKIPLINGIRRSRYFTTMPKSMLVVNGDNVMDDIEAVRNVVGYLRTASIPSEVVERVANNMIEAFSTVGSPTARKKALDSAFNALRAVFRADGHPPEVFDLLMARRAYSTESLKSWLLNRQGLPTDGGWADWFRSQNVSFLDNAGKKALIDDIMVLERKYSITGPTELAHMLDRMIILPNIREVRRLTRNSLFRRLLRDVPKDFKIGPWAPGTKNAISSKRVIHHVVDRKAYEALTDQIDDILAIPKNARSIADETKLAELLDTRANLPKSPQKIMLGQQRAAIELADYMQTFLWKGLNLATFGFIFRNAFDTQFRLYINGLPSLTHHPFEYMQLVMNSSKKMDLKLQSLIKPIVKIEPGEVVDPAQQVARNLKWVDDLNEDFKASVAFDQRRNGWATSADIEQHLRRTNEWPTVSRMKDGTKVYTDAAVLHGAKTVTQDVLRRMAIQGLYEGMPANFVINKIVAFLKSGSDEAVAVRKIITDLLAGGLPMTGRQSGQIGRWAPVYLDLMPEDMVDEWLKAYARNITMTSADVLTGKIPEMQFMHAFGYVPINDGRRAVGGVYLMEDQIDSLGSAARNAAGAEVTDKGILEVGSLVSFKDELDPASFAGARLDPDEVPEIGVITAIDDIPDPAGSLTLTGEVAYIKQYRVQPVYAQAAFDFRGGSPRARQLIDNMPIYEKVGGKVTEGLPTQLAYERIGIERNAGNRLESVQEAMDKALDFFFNNLNTRFVIKWERSPTWRVAYHQAVYENMARLSQDALTEYADDLYNRVGRTEYLRKLKEQADAMPAGPLKDELDSIHGSLVSSDPSKFSDNIAIAYASSSGEAAPLLNRLLKDIDEFLIDWVGDRRIIEDLRKYQDAALGGTVTVDELNDYAGWRANEAVKQSLFDASERMNIEDMLRIMYPFIAAWREITTTYLGYFRTNPIFMGRSVGRVYTGAVNADPDNDGRGFVYRDPQTDQMMFAMPGTGKLLEAMTGVNAPLEAPVRRLSAGLNWLPSMGPIAQSAFSDIVLHLPKAEELTAMFLPYGTKEWTDPANLLPGWAMKAFQALAADETAYGTVYANTLMEVKRALATSGDYDLSVKTEVTQLEKDAVAKARIITLVRSLTQFTGPTALSPDVIVKTKQGDTYVSELSRAFYDMQADPEIGYDRAVQEFLRVFGDDAMIYMSSKTRSVVEGLEPTREFQVWADDNRQIIEEYDTVARYLAPGGSDYDFAIWILQVERGERVWQDFRNQVAQAQNRVGSALFADARRAMGPNPTEDQRDQLRDYRKSLHEKYPGFPEDAEFTVGELYNQIDELTELVADPRVADNEIAIAVNEYLTARREAVEESGVTERGFATAKAAAEGREMLYALGLSLIETTPEFARIFDRLLASELE